MPRPLCFVIMPFGSKADDRGNLVDFDYLYYELLRPAINEAGLDSIRADEELTGGIIHKPMFERLVLCPFAIAELTIPNANVYYELGVRHATRPSSTIVIFAEGTRLPFDLAMTRAIPYRRAADGTIADLPAARSAIAAALQQAREGADDSPVFQLMDLPWRSQLTMLDHEKTDVFRDRVRYSEDRKQQLADARQLGIDAVRNVESDIRSAVGNLQNEEFGVVIDLFLSYRAVKGWPDMIRLVGEMSPPVAQTVIVREQLAFALNREAGVQWKAGKVADARALRGRAIHELEDLIDKRGHSSETDSLLGRIYKDCWEEAQTSKLGAATIQGWLRKAIECYLQGFQADFRDAYPGINAITLMELQSPPDPRREALIPVVRYAVERKIAGRKPDYWDFATRLELAVLGNDRDAAGQALSDAMIHRREPWEPETTARNLRLIREARSQRGEDAAWIRQIEEELLGPGS